MHVPRRARYRSRREVPVRVWITYAAASTGTAEGLLPANEIVGVEALPPRGDWRFAHAERYEELEPQLVPAPDRESPTYSGYVLQVECARLDADFDVVAGASGEHPVSDILDHGRRVFSEQIDDLVAQLSRLIPRYAVWGIVDWQHAPGNDELEGILRYQIKAITQAHGSSPER